MTWHFIQNWEHDSNSRKRHLFYFKVRKTGIVKGENQINYIWILFWNFLSSIFKGTLLCPSRLFFLSFQKMVVFQYLRNSNEEISRLLFVLKGNWHQKEAELLSIIHVWWPPLSAAVDQKRENLTFYGKKNLSVKLLRRIPIFFFFFFCSPFCFPCTMINNNKRRELDFIFKN